MERGFWVKRWENNEIGFHEVEVNPLLIKYVNALKLTKGACVFLPLCGKTLDIAWLLSRGFRIVGAELSALAVEQLFQEIGEVPKINLLGDICCYKAENIEIYQGDIFDLSRGLLGPIDAIYDRAALVALPGKLRAKYTEHLMQITSSAPQLLISYTYDQSLMGGPPFSVGDIEVREMYAGTYDVEILEKSEVAGGLKGKCSATESVWLLS